MPIAPEYLHLVHPGVEFTALLYGRASRDPKKKGRSVEDQLGTGTELCDAYGWPIAETFKDIDRSASRHARRKRDDFEALIDAIDAGRGRIVVAFEASRYYRDIEAYIRLRNACMANEVLLCYNGQVYDLSKREDRKATAQDAIAAEDEAEGIRDRLLRTARSTAAKGTPHGRVLYGYARRYDPDTGDLIEQYKHPTRAPLVHEAFQRIAAGETEYSIIQDFRSRGERLPGVEWRYYHLRNMLRNPGYAGHRVFQGEILREGTWPPIVPQELFDQVQQIVKDPARLTTKDWSVKYLLSGGGQCGECQHFPHLRVVKTRGYRAYQCSDNYHTMMRVSMLDAYVEQALLEWLKLRAADAFRTDDQQEQAAKARTRLGALRQQLAEAQEKAATFDDEGRPRLSVDSLTALEARLLPMIEAAEAESRVVKVTPLLEGLIGAEDVEERWEALTIEQRRSVVRQCVNVFLHRARARGVRSIEPGRVTLTFVGEPGFKARPRRARGNVPAPRPERSLGQADGPPAG
ncbi:recombinase family protein [Streptomyces olivaceus]|uniref:recombinase family protein n=1 Tax=Streptomyces olivaceus TaxID=47716 RepID=UPI001CC94793|nr:recombinase family protein [Streptomyces olivaceus]MBZ6250508.1 recombinase family protein [Streptomyces olivaceus]